MSLWTTIGEWLVLVRKSERLISHPHAIELIAQHGWIAVLGNLLEQEAEGLLKMAAEILAERPLATPEVVANLEGTPLKTDVFLESVLVLLKKNPLYVLLLPLWLFRGKSNLKQNIVRRVELGASVLDHVFKPQEATPVDYLKPLRLQHWLKNLLVFVPLFAAHRFFEFALWQKTVLAFLAFGCCASGGYVLNDLLDLSADRHHPQKRLRTFAAGVLPLSYGLVMILILVGLGCLIALWVSPLFFAVLAIYVALTTTYSFRVRKVALLDVIVLAGLYTVRIMAGSAAIAVWPSHWLLAFSTFLFFSLALVKRYGELVIMRRMDGDQAKARGYELDDGELLAAMGIASGYVAVLVLALYVDSDTAQRLYGRYELMWFLCPLLLYWISHIWLFAHRGKMPDDPVVFAIRDRVSRILILLMLVTTLLAL